MTTLNSISTHEDLQQLLELLQGFYTKRTLVVRVAVQDFTVKRLLSSWFQARKYQNFTLYDQGEALLRSFGKAKENTLIIYDLEMPDRNGLELIAELKKYPHISATLVFVTGPLPPAAQDKLTQAGVSALISRPFQQEVLTAKLTELNLPVE